MKPHDLNGVEYAGSGASHTAAKRSRLEVIQKTHRLSGKRPGLLGFDAHNGGIEIQPVHDANKFAVLGDHDT